MQRNFKVSVNIHVVFYHKESLTPLDLCKSVEQDITEEQVKGLGEEYTEMNGQLKENATELLKEYMTKEWSERIEKIKEVLIRTFTTKEDGLDAYIEIMGCTINPFQFCAMDVLDSSIKVREV